MPNPFLTFRFAVAFLTAALMPVTGVLWLRSFTVVAFVVPPRVDGPPPADTGRPPPESEAYRVTPGTKEAVAPTLAESKDLVDAVLDLARRSPTFRFTDPSDMPLRLAAVYGPEDACLELVYLYELNRLVRAAGGLWPPTLAAAINARVREVEDVLDMDGGPKLEVDPRPAYAEAYTQWYLLLAYALRDQPKDWKDGGPALRLLDGVIAATNNWGSGGGSDRSRVDGSIACAGLYVTLYLYENPTLATNEVGEALGTGRNITPETNPVATDSRRLVKLLRNLCAGIERIRPDMVVGPDRLYDPDRADSTTTPRLLRYNSAGAKGPRPDYERLIGGTAMYHMAKAGLAVEGIRFGAPPADPEAVAARANAAAHRGFARDAIWQGLSWAAAGTKGMDTYNLTYLLRSATLHLNQTIYKKDPNKTKEVADWLRAATKACDGYPFGQDYSNYYRPLAALQLVAQLQAARGALELEAGRP